MDQTLLVAILSLLVFIVGALFINFTVKREEATKKAAQAKPVNVTVAKDSASKAA